MPGLGGGLRGVGAPPSASQAEAEGLEALWKDSLGLQEGKR